MERKGKLIVVAKTGGIKLEGDDNWINPSKGAKGNVLDNLEKIKGLKGQQVVLTMASDNSFSGIHPAEESQAPAPAPTPAPAPAPVSSPATESHNPVKPYLSKDDYWKHKELRDIPLQKQIARHGAINTAIEVLKLLDVKFIDQNQALTNAKLLAEDILVFIKKEEVPQ